MRYSSAAAAATQTTPSISPTGWTAVPKPASTPASSQRRRSSAHRQAAASGSSRPSE